MSETGYILFADDEETFRQSTTELLTNQGYQCDSVVDATEAMNKIKHKEYDLLIADINMPGNVNLELIKYIKQKNINLPVVLVTGYPSVDTAIDSVTLPVLTYLLKPMDFTELLSWVEKGITRKKRYEALKVSDSRLQQCRNEIQELLNNPVKLDDDLDSTMENFTQLTLRNIVGSISDLVVVLNAKTVDDQHKTACHLFSCSLLDQYRTAITEVESVLENTKKSFKSKELAELRKKLELLLQLSPE